MILSVCVLAGNTLAQNHAPTHPVDGEYIREWLVLGPFFPDDLEKDFLADASGEANVNPKEGGTVTTADGKTLTWTRYTAKGNIVDLTDAIGKHDNATAYAFSLLQSETGGDAQIYLGHAGGVVIWMNGKRVYRIPVSNRIIPDSEVFESTLKAGANRFLVKLTSSQPWGLAMRGMMLPKNRAVLSGIITDETGQPIHDAEVRLAQDGQKIAQTQTDAEGSYRLNIYPVRGRYDLSAASGNLGDWKLGISLREGERQRLNFTLREAISISGTVLALDNTPHVAVPVQAIRISDSTNQAVRPFVAAGTLSDEGGEYRLINLLPGRYQVRCQILNGYVYYKSKSVRESRKGITDDDVQDAIGEDEGEILSVEAGKTLKGIDSRFAPFKKGTWKSYTSLDGLGHNVVLGIHGDADGVMWFATNDGVSRYDGKEFVNFTPKDGLAANHVWTIYRDPDGVMWIGTGPFGGSGGVSRYDGKRFVNFTTADGLVDSNVTVIHRDPDGALWFGTYNGVSRYDGQRFVNFTLKDGLAGDRVWGIHRDPDGVMWFATEGGVSRYDGKTFVTFTTKDGLAHNQVSSIYGDPDGTLWFGTWGDGFGRGVSRYDGKRFINFTTKDGLVDNDVYVIQQDSDGVMWFATRGGVSRYDGKTFVNFTTQDGLVNNEVFAIHPAPDGVLWFATVMGGVSRYDRKGVVNLTTKDGLAANYVHAIHGDPDGVIWFGTYGGGISRYAKNNGRLRLTDGKEFVTFTTEDGLVHNRVFAIHRNPDGMMWFGTAGGVSRYDGKGFVNFTTKDGLVHNQVSAIHRDPNGMMWFATGGVWGVGSGAGISRYDGKGFVNFTTKDGLANNRVNAVYGVPDGALWFATEGGVSRYDGKEFVNFTAKDGLPNYMINSIHGDPDGLIWFGTYGGGVSRYNGKEFVNFTMEDGLVDNFVYDIHRDADGVLWVGTHGNGICQYDGVAWASLDTRDGLAGNIVEAIHEDADGYLWFGTDGGVTRYCRSRNAALSAHIVSVQTDELYTNLSVIPPITAGTRVTIEYSSIDFKTVPEKRQYRVCVVEGIAKSAELKKDSGYWLPQTKTTSFDHTFDQPGNYTFAVQAIDRDLNYSEPATLTLQVKRPWWVFVLLGTIGVSIPLIVLGFYFGKRLQTQRAIAQQFNPYIAGRVVGSDLFYGRSDLLTDIERTLANNCFLLYGERRIGKTSLQHQLRERLQNADDPTYRFIPAYIDLQGVVEEDFFRTIAAGIVEHAASLFKGGREVLGLRLDEGDLTDRRYSYRDLNRDLRTILDHLKEGETRTIKLVLLMDEVDTLNSYSLRANLNLRGLFMGPFKENLVLVMSGLYLKMDWSEEGAGSPPFNFLSREIPLEPLNEEDARKLITEPVKGFYTYEAQAVDLIFELSELRPFTIQACCLRAVNRILQDGRTRITVNDIEAIKESVLAEVQSIRGERAGTSLPASLNEALSMITDLQLELARIRE